MKIEPLSSGALRIWMSDEELCRFGLDGIKAGTPATERALRRLLGLARQRLMFCPSGKVTVEALPVDGGCLLLFNGQPRCAAAALPQLYRLDSADALLDFAKALACCEASGLPFASLYREGERYVLIVYAGLGAPDTVRRLLCEFGTPAGTGYAAAAHAEEHLTAVMLADVLPRLREALLPAPPRPLR